MNYLLYTLVVLVVGLILYCLHLRVINDMLIRGLEGWADKRPRRIMEAKSMELSTVNRTLFERKVKKVSRKVKEGK